MTHLLLGIWSQEESAGRKILSTLGFNDEKAKEIAKTAVSFKFFYHIIHFVLVTNSSMKIKHVCVFCRLVEILIGD